jgi:hypothetical protein
VSALLLGGGVSAEERQRLHAFIATHGLDLHVSEPGQNYAYSDANIIADLKKATRR